MTQKNDNSPATRAASEIGGGLRGRPKNLARHIVDEITARIRDKALRPGDKLPTEFAMMSEFGVSRTVVRDAMSRLQAGGLVETRHGIGTFVLPEEELEAIFQNPNHSPVTIRDVIAMMELRISLETEAVVMAAMRASPGHIEALKTTMNDFTRRIEQNDFAVEADKAFHMAIAEATGNKYFVKIFKYLGDVIPRSRLNTPRISSESRRDFLARTYREHEAIFSSIINKDPETARAAMRVHLNSSLERLVKALEAAERPRRDHSAANS